MMVGAQRSDVEAGEASPVAVGAIDRTVWEYLSPWETEERWQAMREQFATPGWGDYEWREMEVVISDFEVAKLFSPNVVKGQVDPDA